MKYLPALAATVAILALAAATYEHFFSDKAKLIQALREQIDEQECIISNLEGVLDDVQKEDSLRMEQIAVLRDSLESIDTRIDTGEASIEDIKNDVTDIDEALSTIAAHTRGSVARSRGIRGTACQGAGG